MAVRVCHACGAAGVPDDPVPRESTCERCGADLRACRNCRHWDVRHHNECRETEADPVSDKTRRNFCEFFDYSTAPFAAPATDRAAEARARLEAMFKKKPDAAPE
jgi:hypothetical protein